ncbi:hypothetical protein PG997_008361 [Apiospora hydei]|uniref:Cysteine-rich transmembrane CYSTM domain-containing protein n=1 Tax=Apiospora hydei TaxID=1337664 RepID=A0ABR1WAQ3_9PEZI
MSKPNGDEPPAYPARGYPPPQDAQYGGYGGMPPQGGYYQPGPQMGYYQQQPGYGPGYPPQQGYYGQPGYYPQGQYQNQRSGGPSFAETLLASLACCCCLDCLLF